MTEKWLLTGGSGFIGDQVAAIALARGHSIVNLDIKPPRSDARKAFWSATDVRDKDDVIQKIRAFEPDRILHLASDIDVAITDIADFKTTIEGTRHVVAAVRQLPLLRRFVHISTQFVVRPGVEPDSERFLLPYTVYGEAKARAETLVWEAGIACPWFILRPTIIWGPGHPSFADQIFRHIGNRTYLHPKAAGPIVRAFGYVRNTATQMCQFAGMAPDATPRRVFYLGDGSMNYDLWADAFSIALTGRAARRIPLAMLTAMGWMGDGLKRMGLRSPIDSGRAFRMSTSSRIDLSATHALTGTPPVSFDEGVKETVDWLKARTAPAASGHLQQ